MRFLPPSAGLLLGWSGLFAFTTTHLLPGSWLISVATAFVAITYFSHLMLQLAIQQKQLGQLQFLLSCMLLGFFVYALNFVLYVFILLAIIMVPQLNGLWSLLFFIASFALLMLHGVPDWQQLKNTLKLTK